MDSQLIRVLPACLTEPLPPGWDRSTEEYLFEVMPEVDLPQAVVLALETTEPDVLLLDADKTGADPFEVATESIKARPSLVVVMISRNNAGDRLRRAMFAGAEEYLVRPFDAQVLNESIINIARSKSLRTVERAALESSDEPNAQGLIVGVLSGKGGMGKTTIAVNMASVVAQASHKTAGLISLDSNGDAAVLLNLQPRLGLIDLAGGIGQRREKGGFAVDWLRQFETHHRCGISYWQWQGGATAEAEELPDDFLLALFETCRRSQSVTFVDFALLTADEASAIFPLLDVILIVSASSDLLALRATKALVDLIPEELTPRVRLLINRSDNSDMISREDFQEAIESRIAAVLPNEPNVAAQAINMGSPFILTQPNTELATTVRQLTEVLFHLKPKEEAAKPRKKFGIFG